MHRKCFNHSGLSPLHVTHTGVSPEYRRGAPRIQPSGNGAWEQEQRHKAEGGMQKARSKRSFGSVATIQGYAIKDYEPDDMTFRYESMYGWQ